MSSEEGAVPAAPVAASPTEPSAQTSAASAAKTVAAPPPDREILTWTEFPVGVRDLADKVVASGFQPDVVVAVARGGLVPGGAVAYALGTKGVGTMNVEFYTDIGQTLEDPHVLPPFMDAAGLPGRNVLVVDDVADSGRTLELVMRLLTQHGCIARSAVLYTKPASTFVPDYSWRASDRWITFPWAPEPPVEGAALPLED
jgi:hypoxanthine phosphoribosyltransferase